MNYIKKVHFIFVFTDCSLPVQVKIIPRNQPGKGKVIRRSLFFNQVLKMARV